MANMPMELFVKNYPSFKTLLGELVEIESPSTDKDAVDRLGARILREVRELGGRAEVVHSEGAGDQLVARWGSGSGGILLLSHMDTVFDLGTLAERPFREADGRLYGPGTLDMKGSIAILLGVVRLFRQQGVWPTRPVMALFTSDEETGSLSSRQLIEEQARQAEVVFCLEPALSNGALKTQRKGTGDIEIRANGVASHAGVDHKKGRNAIEELAHHVLAAQKLTDYSRGTTVNVGVIQGGTRANVVPEKAEAVIDFRVASMDELGRLERWVHSLAPVVEGTSLEATITLNRPPMPRDARMARTFEKARAIGKSLGLELDEGGTGGGSDANFVAPLGIPVLDGLGAVGEGAHSRNEYVRADSIAERAALLAALLLNW